MQQMWEIALDQFEVRIVSRVQKNKLPDVWQKLRTAQQRVPCLLQPLLSQQGDPSFGWDMRTMIWKRLRKKDRGLLDEIKDQPCAACGAAPPVDPAHVRSVGAGGDDVETNCIPLCRHHHTEQHQIGLVSFVRKYSSARTYLEKRGWVVETLFEKSRLVRRE